MNVFIVPTWHPTPSQPLWCNWILPHIDLLRDMGIKFKILQLGFDDEPIPLGTDPWCQPIRFLNDHHLYVPVPKPTKHYQNLCFFYGRFLHKYLNRLRDIYLMAIDNWGKPDILHAHVSLPGGYIASHLGHEFKIPVIVQEHYSGFESDARFWWRRGCFVRDMARNIQGFYAVSQAYANRIENTGLVTVTGVLPNPIDTDLFSPTQRQIKKDSFKIVTTGKYSMRKGTDLLLNSLRLLPENCHWSLTIYGEVEDRACLPNWLRRAPFLDRLTLPGKVPQAELARAYSSSDLFVVSSRLETANVSMLEAMACGLPVVTTSCGGPETLINESVGIIVKSNDAQALAKGIVEAFRNINQYDRDNLRRFVVKNYSKHAMGSLVMKAYQAALQKRKAHR